MAYENGRGYGRRDEHAGYGDRAPRDDRRGGRDGRSPREERRAGRGYGDRAERYADGGHGGYGRRDYDDRTGRNESRGHGDRGGYDRRGDGYDRINDRPGHGGRSYAGRADRTPRNDREYGRRDERDESRGYGSRDFGGRASRDDRADRTPRDREHGRYADRDEFDRAARDGREYARRDDRAFDDHDGRAPSADRREGVDRAPRRGEPRRTEERDGWVHKYSRGWGEQRPERPRREARELRGSHRARQHGADIDSVAPEELAQPAPGTLFCPVGKRCGGCEWLSMPYEQQLDMKQQQIEELFADMKVEVEPIVGMVEPQRFRNKVQLPFAPGRPGPDGRIMPRWGIFERGTHNIVPCRECLVEDERARPIIATVAQLMPRFNIPAYDERTGKGTLRYALVRTALHTGQLMLTLVCNDTRLPSQKILVNELVKAHPDLTTIVLNTNRERTSVILGKDEKVLYGPGYIEDVICGCTFRISSSSFYQTNPVQAEALYDLAIDMAELRPGDAIADAYCGTGTIGIAAAKRTGARLLGVERNADAVTDARANAEANGLDDAEFIVGDAGSVFARMARERDEQGERSQHLDVVFMDPPRAGSTMAFLANLAKLGPRRVVYISCEPKSQRHDVGELRKLGYRVVRIRPVDMFPHTNHVENVVLLERVERPKR